MRVDVGRGVDEASVVAFRERYLLERSLVPETFEVRVIHRHAAFS